jgi:hypothetical protein
LNSPGGSVYAGLGIYDTMPSSSQTLLQFVQEWQPRAVLLCVVRQENALLLHIQE